MNNSDIIIQQLNRLRGQQRIGKVWISCPLGTHRDSKPSLGINNVDSGQYPVGTWYCFGCGKSGSWNAIARVLNLALVDEKVKDTHTKRALHHRTPEVYLDTDHLIRTCYPKLTVLKKWPEPIWRTIPTPVLQQNGCVCIFDPVTNDYGVIMPVLVGGELVGGVKATWEKSELSYVTTPGKWVKETGLLGYDDTKRGQPFVVVEGPRDRWRLERDGVPAIAILGALQWTQAKANLIAARMPPWLLLFFDGDRAGETAKDMIWSSLKDVGLEVKYVNSMRLTEEAQQEAKEAGDPNWEKVSIDPANCKPEFIDKIKKSFELT